MRYGMRYPTKMFLTTLSRYRTFPDQYAHIHPLFNQVSDVEATSASLIKSQ